jgi:hypothetical protein
MKKVRRFKFLCEGLTSNYNGFQWTLGKWHKTKCVELCHGFNCSESILDALNYVKGEILAEVEVKGKHFTDTDKSTWPEMRIIRAWKWQKKDSVALSIFAAELVIQNYEKVYSKDDRPRNAIEAAKAWLSDPSEKNESAARSASRSARSAAESAESAESAAKSAAWSAESAAKSAARSAESAAKSAAWSAWSASKSAWSAAEPAALKKISTWLLDHLSVMEEWKP